MRRTRWLPLIVLLWVAGDLGAATVRTRDGKTYAGDAQFEAGQLKFQPAQGPAAVVAAGDIVDVDFTAPAAPPAAAPATAPAEDDPSGGLKGEYFGQSFSDLRFIRTDPVVDFEFRPGRGHPFATENTWTWKDLSVRWTGQVRPRFSEKYTFHVPSSTHARVWLDDRIIIGEGAGTASRNLEAGKKYPIRIEYIARRSATLVRLEWESISEPRQIIPQDCLFLPAADPDNPPIVHLASPSPGIVPIGPTDILLSAVVKAGGSPLKEIEFRSDQTVLFTATKTPYTFTWTGVSPGDYRISVKATDEKGRTMLTPPLHLLVAGNGGGALPQPWGELNVVKPKEEEVAKQNDGAFTIEHKGGELFAQSDDFHFVFQSLSGNGVLVARIAGLQTDKKDAHPLAGVMIRAAAVPGSPQAAVLFSPGVGAIFVYRAIADGQAANSSSNSQMPVFFKLAREGTTFRSYRSDDGQKWEFVGEQTIDMPRDVLAGLAVCSGIEGTTATGIFDQVTLTRTAVAREPADAGKAIVLTDGTRLPGELKTTADGKATIERGGPVAIDTRRIARLFYKPVREETLAQLTADQTGVILRNGDFYDGDVNYNQYGVIVSSVVFGPRRFAPRDISAIVLRPVVPPTGFEIRTGDGAVFYGPALTIDKDGLHVSTVLGPMTLAPKDLATIKLLSPQK